MQKFNIISEKIILIVIILMITISCKKEVEKNNLNAEQQRREEVNKKAAKIMAKIVRDGAVRQEIYETVSAITMQHEWRDEAVYFKEILPNNYNSILNRNSVIATAIKRELGYYNNTNQRNTNETIEDIINELINLDIEFYFPYHEDFPTPQNFAVTYQNEISEDENKGYIYIQNQEQTVLVNETYAIANPVLIIGQFNNNRQAPDTITNTNNQRNILLPMYVNIGRIKYTNDHEGFMMGGPEFTFYRAKGSINVNNQNNYVTTQDRINKDYKRKDKDKWHSINSMIDHSWELLEFNQVFGIYERDGGAKELVNLNVNVEIEIAGVKIPLGVNLNIGTNDDEVGFNTYNRTMFFNTNRPNINLGNGTEQTWPIYHMNGIYFTMPIIIN